MSKWIEDQTTFTPGELFIGLAYAIPCGLAIWALLIALFVWA